MGKEEEKQREALCHDNKTRGKDDEGGASETARQTEGQEEEEEEEEGERQRRKEDGDCRCSTSARGEVRSAKAFRALGRARRGLAPQNRGSERSATGRHGRARGMQKR